MKGIQKQGIEEARLFGNAYNKDSGEHINTSKKKRSFQFEIKNIADLNILLHQMNSLNLHDLKINPPKMKSTK